uniref:ribonuclease H n=1 Tax=uncultured organism TaxID=155900 RepID=A0A0F6PZU3_9ZZZZ|nr:putative ribonuclease HII [uncultured organism]
MSESTNTKYIAGMDEAGRGPAIGPIVFGIVLVTKKQERELQEGGVKDSKALTSQKRDQFEEEIRDIVSFCNTLQLSAEQIDTKRKNGINLNQIEVNAFKQLLAPYAKKINKLQLDAADVNEKRFGRNFEEMINGKIISKHKGDAIFISVGAASILAKVERDQTIIRLQSEMDAFDSSLPSFRSGYPTDAKPFLQAYVSKYKKLPNIARHSWKTCSKILENEMGPKQRSLEDY